MIHNNLCAYCRVTFNNIQNHQNSKTVEHLIPNSLTLKKRNNNNGDFYACKKCNSDKSKMDNLVAKVSKFQSFDDKLATDTMAQEYTKDKTNPKLVKVLTNTDKGQFGIYGKLPFNGQEIYEYMEYLGKGEYLKQTNKVFSKYKNVMTFLYLNKEANIIFSDKYKKSHGTNNFNDLMKNEYTEVLNEGECMIYTKDKNKFMFVFHHHTVIIVTIDKSSSRTKKLVLKNKERILRDFG